MSTWRPLHTICLVLTVPSFVLLAVIQWAVRPAFAPYGNALPLRLDVALHPGTSIAVAFLVAVLAAVAIAQPRDRDLLLPWVPAVGIVITLALFALIYVPLR